MNSTAAIHRTTSRQGRDLRGFVGATIQLYGMPGSWTILSQASDDSIIGRHNDWVVRDSGARNDLGTMHALDASIVRVDGAKVAMRSLPLAAPAKDYDGPTLLEITEAEREVFASWPRVPGGRRAYAIT